ncbi:acyltransferase domain-containing protein [Nocardia yamanashiensis]|uniref:acyltransferase domain-containing protein n=1 Tax=Nocardia yamanashiensis TaxID=209247 RepID=UPI001E30BCAF|nr:acyltransferase domain-containing protein [Nocardia yamanashiensis]UGT40597.1 acyltransferase domain-containing protein [Nocardia yamanashiensis]
MRQSTTASNDSTPFPRVSIVGVGCRAADPEFDRDWFGISATDAAGLDPRHRVSLEIAVEALDDAGLGCLAAGSAAAVVFGASGFTTPNAARLLSRALDLHGPSLLVDSESDTPLIAVDTAVRLLADESIPFVLAGGTDLTVLPDISGIQLSGDGDLCTVLVLQRTADAARTGARRYADIAAPALGSPRQGLTRIDLHDHHHAPSPRDHRTGSERGYRDATTTACAAIGNTTGTTDTGQSTAAPGSRATGTAVDEPPPSSSDGGYGRFPRTDSPVRAAPTPFPILLGGPDAAAIRVQALHWAHRVGAYRSVHEFATATARLLPEPTRAAVLARDPGEAATQLRILAARIPAAPPPPVTPAPSLGRRTRATTAVVHDSSGNVATQHPEPPGTTVRQHDSAADSTDAPVRPAASGAMTGSATGSIGTRAGHRLPTGHAPERWEGVELPALRWATPVEGDVFGPQAGQREGGLLFLFSGSGFHPRMGRGLAGRYPVFARRLTEAADAVAEAGGPRVWTPRHGFGNCSTGPDFTQPALFVYQVALAALLEFWGVLPDALAGHGPGEIAAAVAAGVLLLPDAARIVVARGRLLDLAGEESAAAVLEATPAEALRLVEPMRTAVGLAAIHGPSSVTVTGEPRYIDALVRRAHRRAIFAQRVAANSVDGSAATIVHIPRARTIAPQLISTLDGLTSAAPRHRFYSTTRRGALITGPAADDASAAARSSAHGRFGAGPGRNGENRIGAPAIVDADSGGGHPAPPYRPATGDGRATDGHAAAARNGTPVVPARSGDRTSSDFAVMDADYWGANAAGPVELAAALERGVAEGVSTVLELAPQPVLAAAVRDYGAVRDATYTTGSATDEAGALLRVLAQLHVEGRRVDWQALGAHTVTPPRRLWRRPGTRREHDRAGFPVDAAGEISGGIGHSNVATRERRSARPGVPGGPEGRPDPGNPADRPGETFAAGAPDDSANAYSLPGDGRWLGPLPGVMVRGDATYVVAGGLGAYGATAVRWLLDAGARDVVVLTRVPRALPTLLEGLEDRVVMVRCDVGDRRDLGAALHDIRECGLPIRGVVYARAELREGVVAALAELTAGDPIEFAWLLGDGGWRRMPRVSGGDGVAARE